MLERMADTLLSCASSPTPWPKGFMVLHGNRLEDLRQLLMSHVRAHPLPGLSPECIVVQSNGMKQWLEQGLASPQGLGVCAATRMLFPAEMLWESYRSVLGPDRVPAQMPLDREHLVWRLMRLLPELLHTDAAASAVYGPLRRYVAAGSGGIDDTRMLQLCQQLAHLYDGYQNYRADWLRDWGRGLDGVTDARGQRQPWPEGAAWQGPLWRALLSDVARQFPGTDGLPPSRVEVHQAFMQAIGTAPCTELPRRILVFGVSALPMQSIEALAAMGQHVQVMVFVLNPCRYHWGHVVSERHSDEHTEAQPLLAAWGQQGRDFLHLLDMHDNKTAYQHLLERIDFFAEPWSDASEATATRLQRLQSDILNLNPVPEPAAPAQSDDVSFVLVRAHSALREVELLHDRILGWLATDPTLRPRDIIVMVPDMSPFAPLIHAVWGRFETGDPRRIAYSVADQSAKEHPMAGIVEALLQGPSARLTLDDWLSWLEVPAFARACGFPMEEWPQVRNALAECGVRWGLDGVHRIEAGVALSPELARPNTWLFGLQRLLLAQAQGVMAAGPWEGVWPAQPKEALSVAALNALCTSLRTLERVLGAVRAPRSPAEWGRDLKALVDDVLVAGNEVEERALLALMAPLNAWLTSCQIAALSEPVSLTVVRTWWMAGLAETGVGNRFLSGGVQFATLMPMRSIPFRRVCLLGMNDGQYPRRQYQTDFDLMRLKDMRRPGDRSRREDDCFLFLEALLCAREQFYISWQGWQSTDQSELYPSVLVGQLIDHLNATHQPNLEVLDAPMQGYSRRYFESPHSAWRTFAQDWAQARGWNPAAEQPRSPEQLLPVAAPTEVDLKHISAMLRQPLDVFYRHRLNMDIRAPEAPLADAEPFDLNTLEMHRLVRAALAHPNDWEVMARASGLLPLGSMAQRPLQRLQSQVRALGDRLQSVLQSAAWLAMDEQAVRWESGGAENQEPPQALKGTLGGPMWYRLGSGAVMQFVLRPGALSKSKVMRIHTLLPAWAAHVLANASGLPCTTHWIGLGEHKVLGPMPSESAQAVLADWLSLYRRAWAEPLAVPGESACLWLAQTLAPGKETDLGKRHKKAHAEARTLFMGSQQSRREAERQTVGMMRRHASNYSDVAAAIEEHAPVLYADLLRALQGLSGEAGGGDDE